MMITLKGREEEKGQDINLNLPSLHDYERRVNLIADVKFSPNMKMLNV